MRSGTARAWHQGNLRSRAADRLPQLGAARAATQTLWIAVYRSAASHHVSHGASHWVAPDCNLRSTRPPISLHLSRHDDPMNPTIHEVAEPQDTRATMTRLSARGYAAVRQVLVQLPDEKLTERGSTLGRMVHERSHRALLLYLLLLTCWPWLRENHQPLPAKVWIRALTASGAPTWSPSTLSRAWADLEEFGLLEQRQREARAVRVKPRREDGKDSYDPPGGRRSGEHRYFVLPDTFWNDELFAKLTLPGLAVLLIIAKETNSLKKKEMYVPLKQARAWYGVSAKTLQNGLHDLDRHGLLHRREERIKAPLSATGWTTRVWYSLTGDFGSEARAALRKRARTERAARLGVKPASVATKRAAPVVSIARTARARRTTKPTSRKTVVAGGRARSTRNETN